MGRSVVFKKGRLSDNLERHNRERHHVAYPPKQNYPQAGYGGTPERIGRWAWVHGLQVPLLIGEPMSSHGKSFR